MIRAATVLLLAAAVIAPSAAFAQSTPGTAPITATVDPTRRALGHELAKLLNSEEGTMRLIDRLLSEQLPKAMMADSNVRTMETAYPGIVKAMIDAMKPILMRYMRTELPELWDELAVLFASNMDESELRAAIAFYRSPLGAMVIEVMENETDFGPALTEMARTGNYDMSERNLTDSAMTGANKIADRMTPEQGQEAIRFIQTPAGRKIVALTPQVMQVVMRWSSEPTPELDAELEKAAGEVVYKFTGMRI